MSRVEDLIGRFAPDGVPVKTLGDVGEFVRGNGLKKSDLTHEGAPAIHYGQIHTHYGVWATATKSFTDPAYAVKLRKARHGDLIVATTSEDDAAVAKATAWIGEGEVAVGGDAYIFRHTLDPRYVSYFFQSRNFQEQKVRHITGAKVRRVSGASLTKVLIPVPPLEVQREIVKVLDQFSELRAVLEVELEARQRQYEYYSGLLLESSGAVEAVPLGDLLLKVIDHRGKTPKKLGGDWSRSGHRVVSAINFKGGRVDDNYHRYINDEMFIKWMKVPLQPGDVLLTSEAPLGSVAFIDKHVDWAIGQRVFALRVDTSRVNPKYLYHLLRAGAPRAELLSRSTGSTVSGIRQAELVKVPVSLPTLEEQERVVSVLDNFASLTGDASSGLPAELMARRKQYEYYRDKLLTFEEAPA